MQALAAYTGPERACSTAAADNCLQQDRRGSQTVRNANARPGVRNPRSACENGICIEIWDGIGRFVDPPEFTVEEPGTLQFVVGENDLAVTRQVGEGIALGRRNTVTLGNEMRVTLSPPAEFDLLSANGEVRRLDEGRASWRWSVRPRPRVRGRHQIFARVEVGRTRTDGRFVPLREYEEHVFVIVAVGDRRVDYVVADLTNFGEKLRGLFDSWAAMLAALSALILAFFGVRAALRGKKPKTS